MYTSSRQYIYISVINYTLKRSMALKYSQNVAEGLTGWPKRGTFASEESYVFSAPAFLWRFFTSKMEIMVPVDSNFLICISSNSGRRN